MFGRAAGPELIPRKRHLHLPYLILLLRRRRPWGSQLAFPVYDDAHVLLREQACNRRNAGNENGMEERRRSSRLDAGSPGEDPEDQQPSSISLISGVRSEPAGSPREGRTWCCSSAGAGGFAISSSASMAEFTRPMLLFSSPQCPVPRVRMVLAKRNTSPLRITDDPQHREIAVIIPKARRRRYRRGMTL